MASSGGKSLIAMLKSKGEMTGPCGVPWGNAGKGGVHKWAISPVAGRLVRRAPT